MAKSITAEKFDNNCWKLNISIPKGSNGDSDDSLSNILKRIKLISQPVGSSSTDTSGVISYNNVQLSYAERGPVGKAAASTLLPYQDGFWVKSKTYKKTATTVPYVSHNGKYYLLIVDSCTNKEPGTTSGQSYWEEMPKYNQILTKFLVANNAVFGSSVGSVIHNNFLFSQLGEDPIENEIRYSNLEHGESGVYQPFETTEKTIDGKKYTVSELTGEFIPNTSINFFNGTMSCNKLSEKFETFDLIDVNTDIDIKYKYKPLSFGGDSIDDNPGWVGSSMSFDDEIKISCKPVIYNYTHFMDKNGSFNINVAPRLQYVHKKGVISDGAYYMDEDYLWVDDKTYDLGLETNIFNGFYINGTIVLPDVEKDNIAEGTHIFINNPNWLPSLINDYSVKVFTDDDINSITPVPERATLNACYLDIINPKTSMGMASYISDDSVGPIVKNLVKENLFFMDTNDKININDYFHSTVQGYVLVCSDPNMFDKSKYDENQAKYYGDENNNCFLWNGKKCKFILLSRGSILKLRSVNLTKKFISYDITSGDEKGTILKKIGSACIREKVVGTQWIIENTADFSELPLNVWINDINNDAADKYYHNVFEYKVGDNIVALGSGVTNENTYWIKNPNIYARVSEDEMYIEQKSTNPNQFPYKIPYDNFAKKSVFDNGLIDSNNPLVISLDINVKSGLDNLMDFENYSKDSDGYYNITGSLSAGDVWPSKVEDYVSRPENSLGNYNKMNGYIGFGSTNFLRYGDKNFPHMEPHYQTMNKPLYTNSIFDFDDDVSWGSGHYTQNYMMSSGNNTYAFYENFVDDAVIYNQWGIGCTTGSGIGKTSYNLSSYPTACENVWVADYAHRGIYLYDAIPLQKMGIWGSDGLTIGSKRNASICDLIFNGALSNYNIRGVYRPYHMKECGA